MLTHDRRSLLLFAALGASLALHAVAVALVPVTATVKLADSPLQLAWVAVTTAPAPKPLPPPPPARAPTKAVRAVKRAAAPAPSAAAPTVADQGGSVAAPVSPQPFTFQAKFAPPPTTKPLGDEVVPGTDPTGAGVAETKPVLLQAVKPAYPEAARREELEGEVVLRVLVGPDGRVESAEVESSTSPVFERPAREAMLQVRFTPATRGGQPVRTTLRHRYVFRLD